MTTLLRRLSQLTLMWRLVFYAVAAAIIYLATTPLDYPVPASSWDKLNHVMAFTVLAGLLSLGHRRLHPLLQGLLLLGYGLLIEVWQYFLPSRYFELADLLADGIGVAIGLLVMAGFWRWMATTREGSEAGSQSS